MLHLFIPPSSFPAEPPGNYPSFTVSVILLLPECHLQLSCMIPEWIIIQYVLFQTSSFHLAICIWVSSMYFQGYRLFKIHQQCILNTYYGPGGVAGAEYAEVDKTSNICPWPKLWHSQICSIQQQQKFQGNKSCTCYVKGLLCFSWGNHLLISSTVRRSMVTTRYTIFPTDQFPLLTVTGISQSGW